MARIPSFKRLLGAILSFILKFSLSLAFSQLVEHYCFAGQSMYSWLWVINETKAVNVEAQRKLAKIWTDYTFEKSIKTNICVILVFAWIYGKGIVKCQNLSTLASYCFYTALAFYVLGFPEKILSNSLHWQVHLHLGIWAFYMFVGYSAIWALRPGRRLTALIGGRQKLE